jgi:preprotein translocase subunit SecY
VSLGERVATTAMVPILLWGVGQIPLAHLEVGLFPKGAPSLSPLELGLMPFFTAFGLVELVALLVPRWRGARRTARGRVRLERIATWLAIGFALTQAFSLVLRWESLGVFTETGWESRVVQVATLVAGTCFLSLVARRATRRGLVNGYMLCWTVPGVQQLLRVSPFQSAALRGGMQDVALLAITLVVPIAATWIAVRGADAIEAAIPRDASAYRGESVKAPRPTFPIPVSSITPVHLAASLLLLPAVLANLKVPGMAELQAVMQRGDMRFNAAYGVVIVFFGLVAAALLHHPAEVASLLGRLGSVSDETARAQANAALRRSLLPTFAFLGALVFSAHAAQGLSKGAPSMTLVATMTAVFIDLVRSLRTHLRARDLVCVAEERDAWAVPALRAALGAEGIDARVRGMAVLSVLQAFAAYTPVELFVPAGNAERAIGLLRHWASGDAKPASASPFVPRPEVAPWPLPVRSAALGALCVASLIIHSVPPPGQVLSPRRADIAVVRIDDEADPLSSVRVNDPPAGLAVFAESVPLGSTPSGGNQTERRAYVRATLGAGESIDAAWKRVLPWLQGISLPAGDRWTFEEVAEADDEDKDKEPVSFHVVGLRTLVMTGDPILTTRDVSDAEVGIQDESSYGLAYVTITLTDEAADRFYRATSEWVNRRIAIVVDGQVNSAPVVRSPIRGGKVTITMGTASQDKQLSEARALAASLRAGH